MNFARRIQSTAPARCGGGRFGSSGSFATKPNRASSCATRTAAAAAANTSVLSFWSSSFLIETIAPGVAPPAGGKRRHARHIAPYYDLAVDADADAGDLKGAQIGARLCV